MRRLILFTAAFVFTPACVLAHEVYVLPKDVVLHAMTMPPLAVFDIVRSNAHQFFFWAFITAWTILTIFLISISKPIEHSLHPWLARIKTYAPLVARLTLGSAITASGYFGAIFGPELLFSDFLPASIAPEAGLFLIILGTLITAGLFTRICASLLILTYVYMWFHYGTYMLTYINYFGEMVLTLVAGNAVYAVDRYFHHLYPHLLHNIVPWLEEHTFLIVRVTFGLSLIYASLYAKFLHAQLALDTVLMYHLTNYFPFEPSFIVLGALCIELLLGLFFVFGIEVRFASLFLLFWLTLSLLYFKEAVWPHIVLAGVAITIFMHGYDRYTFQVRMMGKRLKASFEPMF